uniref:Uncharacterized protein n=1 Tax=Spongospora subterranea TaxID=70186 RepID=A0A0H5R916_9EUKA|eukprot:CRZ04879.1 hypothetical protein [Spongospora subterranea]
MLTSHLRLSISQFPEASEHRNFFVTARCGKAKNFRASRLCRIPGQSWGQLHQERRKCPYHYRKALSRDGWVKHGSSCASFSCCRLPGANTSDGRPITDAAKRDRPAFHANCTIRRRYRNEITNQTAFQS